MKTTEGSNIDGSWHVEIPIDGVLDLHSFSPKQVKELVYDYLDACQQRGVWIVRIIHGKGTGTLKRTVHSLLSRHPAVIEFYLDNNLFSGDGATIVRLRKLP
ncbi:MAG: Smr/MutS family protein [Verrucomicrobiae bacterium]|nr:Smr/MutS family protein [Verrucomicrobiae bacterium]